MMKDNDKIWDALTKEYLTTEQKLAIIREHNERISDKLWENLQADIAKYFNDKKRKEPK